MTLSSPDIPPDEVSEADWAEQALDVDPLPDDAEVDALAQPVTVGRGIVEADDADLAEQEALVYGEDDDIRR
jgi:hypothetical protein